MALYESVFIARQDVSATQVDSLTDSFEKIISDNGGSVARREYWGLRTLAYRIKKTAKVITSCLTWKHRRALFRKWNVICA